MKRSSAKKSLLNVTALFAACGLLTAALVTTLHAAGESAPLETAAAATQTAEGAPEPLSLFVGKSVLVKSSSPIERVAVGFGDIAEASAVSAREVLLNGKTPGVTSLILWQKGGGKLFFDVTVKSSSFGATNRVDAVDRELKQELPGQSIELTYDNDTVFLRGRVKDLVSAQRAVAIASTLGKAVNLLYVDVPPAEAQVLLKVRFATIDRTASLDLGLNLASTGATNTIGSVTTQQFSPPVVAKTATGTTTTLSDALNVFLLRPDLNLLATIRALQRKSMLEILAEPNVLAMNGKPASFLAGGEFPYPTLQAGTSGVGTVTVQFREFGVRLNFTPIITPRGTIRLQVAPEVSALDFASGLVVQGFSVPALIVRKVSTEIELSAGQSFAIGGLIDNRLTESVYKLPILGDFPGIGKLFQSKSRLRENTELLIIVTPELVAPMSKEAIPDMKFPKSLVTPSTIPADANPPAEALPPPAETIPFETLLKSMQPLTPDPQQAAPQGPGAISSSAAPPPPSGLK